MSYPLILISIVTEGILKDRIAKLLLSHGVSGYTVIRAEGEGSRGVRALDWEGPNQKFEVITTQAIADQVIEDLSQNYFDNYAVIAWLTEVSVLRGDKFS